MWEISKKDTETEMSVSSHVKYHSQTKLPQYWWKQQLFFPQECRSKEYRYYRKQGDPRLSSKDDTGCCLLQLGSFRYEYLKVSESI